MKLELINPFISGAFGVLERVVGVCPTKGELRLQRDGTTCNQVNVAVGVTGHVTGHLIYGMGLQVADKIASIMIGQPVRTFDKLAASAIAELGNMISGNGLLGLSDLGLICEVTPPTVIRGTQVEFNTLTIPALVVPLIFEFGEISITVGLQQVK